LLPPLRTHGYYSTEREKFGDRGSLGKTWFFNSPVTAEKPYPCGIWKDTTERVTITSVWEAFVEQENAPFESAPPFPVPSYRFDQKNEMFKRSVWDEKMRPYRKRFCEEILFQEKAGYRKLDYAFLNGMWNVERSFGANGRSNAGLYAWDAVPDRIKRSAGIGDSVKAAPEEMSRIIKRVARFLGAEVTGICSVHPNWVYSHEFNPITGEHYPFDIPEDSHAAIVMAIAMDYEAIRCSPGGVAAAATGLGYSQMAFVANLLAAFIRSLGYRAIPSGNDAALSIPLAMAAGLGEGSRMGLLITEKYGPRVRLCKVFTNLPLQVDVYRTFGAWEFCKSCKKCATHCPSQAIPHGEMTTEGPNVSSQSGVLKWHVDAEKCFSFWAKNRMSCSVCIRVCPFNKKPGVIHDAIRGVIKRTTLFNGLFTKMDRAFGYDKTFAPEKFWDSH
jgi:epoxyqueuosine reductase